MRWQGVKLCLIQAPVRLNFSLWRPNPEIHHYWWFVRKGMFFIFTKNSWFSCLLLVKWRKFWDKLIKQINKGMIKKYFPHPPPWNVWSDLTAFSNHIMLKSRKKKFFFFYFSVFLYKLYSSVLSNKTAISYLNSLTGWHPPRARWVFFILWTLFGPTMLIQNFSCTCIHCSVSIVCFVQSVFCYKL